MDSPRGTAGDPFVDDTPAEVRILHVDDDRELNAQVADLLEARYESVTVHTATRAEEGLETLSNGRVDCIVSGYDMPGMDGIEFLETVRADHPELPFVLFPAEGSEGIASAAISSGVTDYMQRDQGPKQFHLLGNRIKNAVDQYRARRKLAESEERYRTVVENSFEGVYIYSGDRFLFANHRIEELTGYDLAELADIDIFTLLHPDDRERVRDIAERRADPEREAPSTYEARVLRKDGSVRHCEFAVEAITYQGEGAALGSVRDITQRRERQAQLERYETMVEVSGDPMYTLDDAGQFTYVNDRLCERSGYDREELIGAHVSKVMTEDDVDRGEAVIQALLEDDTMEEATFEMDILTASGDRIESENHIALLPRDDGEFVGTVGVVRDIGDRKRRERRLSRLHEAAMTLGVADSEDAVYEELVDTGRAILDFDFVSVDSVEGDRLVMRENTDVDGGDYFEEVPLDPDQSLAARAVLDGETSRIDDLRELDVTPADPAYRSALTVPIGDRAVFQAGAKSIGAFDAVDQEMAEVLAEHARTALSNIENRRQLRAQRRELERENQRLEEFASVVSHDLRNPLTVAAGRLADASRECDSEALDDVEGALDRMERLIADLLDLARQGQRVEEPEPVGLPSLVEESWANVSTDGARLEVLATGTIRADASRTAQLFENLFRNSLEHGRDGEGVADPEMTITVGDLEGGFFVADDGAGIPEDERDQVFETGYSRSEEGTGFGLSIVEQVAAAHGWEVALTEGPAGGARFEFTGVEFVEDE